MVVSWNAQSGSDSMIADRNLYLDKSQNVLVEENDSRCASLLCGKGRAIYADEVQRLGLAVVGGRVVQPSSEPEVAAEVEAPSTEEDEHGAAEG